ncbi:tyrosine-type recombinase/integrase [Halobacterium hubeiense]|uniref:tyrosine-type recombinase/integrase n=1 Tax=Halobacterium hubeiense TaxID=1407499 RepID=UPI003C722446
MRHHPVKSITEKLANALGDSAVAVEEFLADYYTWLRKCGRNPARNEPLAANGAANYHARIDQLYRFTLEFDDLRAGYRLTNAHADELIRRLDNDEIRKRSGDPYDSSSKRKFSDALQKYFTFLDDNDFIAEPWEPNVVFVDGDHTSAASLTFVESYQIRNAALEYGSLPSYSETSDDERDRINALIAQRLGKPKAAVTQQDWMVADTSAKVGSLIAVALETALIPIEIEQATVDWYNPKQQLFVVPEEHAAKSRPENELPLTDATAEVFSHWLRERRHLETYDDTNRIWLNQQGNPYTSGSLCYLLRQLCEAADIDHETRKISWYSIRHTLAEIIKEVGDLEEASDQLRHNELETTKDIYAKTHPESRRQTLEKVHEIAERAAIDETYNPYARDDYDDSVGSDSAASSENRGDTSTMHVDVKIEDSMAGRSQLARDILDTDDEEK